MSRVFMALDGNLNRHVVVKVLDPALAAAISAERFAREIRLTAALQEPHIVPVHSAGETTGGLPYYTMPFIEGETLRQRLARGPIPVAESLLILRDVARALAYAHAHGVVHRDVKPENILLSSGTAVVSDFGIAKAIQVARTSPGSRSATTLTAIGMSVGTPAYMAPEQVAGDPTTDHRADLYAFGLIAYEMLTGTHPFVGRSAQALLRAHVMEDVPSLAIARPSLPRALVEVVDGCLAKAPSDRPGGAAELVQQFDAMSTRAGSEAATNWRRTTSRKRVVATATLLLATVAAAAALWRRERPTSVAPTTTDSLVRMVVAPLENRTGDRSLDAVADMTADWLTQGIARVGVARVVDAQTARISAAAARTLVEGGRARNFPSALGELTGASIVVSGALYRDGDSLAVQATAVRSSDGEVLLAAPPVRAPAAQPAAIAQASRMALTVALTRVADPTSDQRMTWPEHPPDLDAYRAYRDGVAAWYRRDFATALPALRRAAALDSTFVSARWYVCEIYVRLGDRVHADSVERGLRALRPRMLRWEQLQADWLHARVRSDNEGQLNAVRASAELNPHSEAMYAWGVMAVRSNRPRESLVALDQDGPLTPWNASRGAYWYHVTMADHMLGDFARELKDSRHGPAERMFPIQSALYAGRALAALGDTAGAMRRALEARSFTAGVFERGGSVMLEVALELRAHGHPAAADSLLRAARAWLAGRPVSERDSVPTLRDAAEVAYALGEWADAERRFAALEAGPQRRLGDVARLVTARLRLGQVRDLRAATAGLDTTMIGENAGLPTYLRARIAAVRGDRAGAVALLRRAYQEGHAFDLELHRDPDLAILHGWGPFEAFVAPRG